MTTTTLTLTDFLLARIAEDEAYLAAAEDGMYALGFDYPPSLSALQSADRFRAECKGRRWLVDHPDYRQEWRP